MDIYIAFSRQPGSHPACRLPSARLWSYRYWYLVIWVCRYKIQGETVWLTDNMVWGPHGSVAPPSARVPGSGETSFDFVSREPGRRELVAWAGPGPRSHAGIQTHVSCISAAWPSHMRPTKRAHSIQNYIVFVQKGWYSCSTPLREKVEPKQETEHRLSARWSKPFFVLHANSYVRGFLCLIWWDADESCVMSHAWIILRTTKSTNWLGVYVIIIIHGMHVWAIPWVNHDTSYYYLIKLSRSLYLLYDYIMQIDGLHMKISNEIMHSRLHIRDFPIFRKGMVPCKEC